MKKVKQYRRETTEFRTLKQAKAEHKILKQYPESFNKGLNEILTAFSKALVPQWGSLVFNGVRVN